MSPPLTKIGILLPLHTVSKLSLSCETAQMPMQALVVSSAIVRGSALSRLSWSMTDSMSSADGQVVVPPPIGGLPRVVVGLSAGQK